MKRGKLITIDGTDSSFKETQVNLTKKRLVSERYSCKTMDFPRYLQQPTGRIIGQCYLGKDTDFYGWNGDTGWFPEGATNVDPLEISPFYSADRHREKSQLNHWLEQGEIIILDRYDSANKIHQGGKLPLEKRIAFWKKLDLIEYDYFENIKPDLTILLHNPTEIAIEIRKAGDEKKDEHESSFNHLKSAEEAALQAAEYYDWKVVECATGKTMDSLRSRKDINEEVYSHIKKIL